MDASRGDVSAELVTEVANWAHPSWSRDGRHITACRDNALFIVDSQEGGDKPIQMFHAKGNWVSPCWAR